MTDTNIALAPFTAADSLTLFRLKRNAAGPTPGDQAGTVTVTLSPAGQHSPDSQHSEVEVTYELTALTSLAEHKLTEFADGYPAYLRSWQDSIASLLRDAGTGHTEHSRVARDDG